MSLLRKFAVRLPIVAIGAAAWLAISNHCALTALEGAARMPMPGCHGMPAQHQSPAKPAQKGEVECCKVLRATLLAASKSIAPADTMSYAAFAYVVGVIPSVDAIGFARILEWDTGPPGAQSFAESVLQRSILAHAPPLSLS